ncbi:hypothetical protein BJY01DRAFT_255520 [Aspergillus pseudoustus]|uniref:Nephrocystin 3-like N-terminal domain-containing protein n=1 Tax=Aspergillus pseudoustus TaxID=1810923 RepID=A0ABR4IJG6_9EURO
MDPITALGLVSGIISIIDFGTKVLSGAKEVYGSGHGATAENRSLASITTEMQKLSVGFIIPDNTKLGSQERAISIVAAECKAVSDDILKLLEKINSSKTGSRRESLWTAVKAAWYQDEREELLSRLDRCQSQLSLHLDALNRSETKEYFDRLLDSSRTHSGNLQRVENEISKIRQWITAANSTGDSQSRIFRFIDSLEAAGDRLAQGLILKALNFEDMHSRVETVVDAHCDTFGWIFDDDDNGSDDDDSGKRFTQWLSSGGGIFHIAGKLGSGKSTLMKLLYSHPRTWAELQKWAGNRRLIIAKHFFWKPGSPLQKSLAGLVRSLLYAILQACPELIASTFAEHWELVKQSYMAQPDIRLTAADIEIGFRRVTSSPLNCCFCLFVDGLDEYDESLKESYRDLVNMLCSWTRLHPESVKICVSSREYNVFSRMAPDEQRLRLQDLTRRDIEAYVQEQLGGIDGADEENGLIGSIVEKANGVFLWVAVVTKSIRDLFEDGFDVSTMKQELDSLPLELADLFKHVLISKRSISMRRMAFRTFAMVITANKPPRPPFTLSMYYFMEDYDKDPGFALEALTLKHESNSSGVPRAQRARRMLIGCCSGLVEPAGDSGDLSFTHRSVPEFLDMPDIKCEMDKHLEQFSPVDALSQLFVAELRYSTLLGSAPEVGGLDGGEVLRNLIIARGRANLDCAPFPFLETVRRLMIESGIDEWPRDACDKIVLWQRGRSALPRSKKGRYNVVYPLHVCAREGYNDYLSWKMDHDPVLNADCRKYGFLMWLAGSDLGYRASTLAQLLLERGLPPKTIIHSGYALIGGHFEREMTFWEGFIYSIIREHNAADDTNSRQRMGQAIQSFLEKGADHRFQLFMAPQDDPVGESEHSSEVSDSSERSPGSEYSSESSDFSESSAALDNLIISMGNHRWELPRPSKALCEFIESRNGIVSLPDLVDYWVLPNRDTIQALIQERIWKLPTEADSPEDERYVPRAADSTADTNGQSPLITSCSLVCQLAIMLLGIVLGCAAFWIWRGRS